MIQILDGNGSTIEFTDVDSLINFIISNSNTNIDLKRGLSQVANLNDSDEKALMMTGDYDIIKIILGRLTNLDYIQYVENDADIVHYDTIFNLLFNSNFNINHTVTQNLQLNRAMIDANFSFKYTDGFNVLSNFIVVDSDGNAVTTREVTFKKTILNPLSILDWLAENPSRTEDEYPLTEIVVDGEGVVVWETEVLDFTISNRFSLDHLTGLIVEKTGKLYDDTLRELHISILDNKSTPWEHISKFLSFSDITLQSKAIIHQNNTNTALLESFKTNAVTSTQKYVLVNSIATPEQFTKCKSVLAHYLKSDSKSLIRASFLASIRVLLNENYDDLIYPELTDELINSLKMSFTWMNKDI